MLVANVSVSTATIVEFLQLSLRVVLIHAWKKKRFWGEAGARYVPTGSNEMKVWGQWNGYLLVDCCLLAVILGSNCVEICWRLAHWECFPSVWSGVKVARTGT